MPPLCAVGRYYDDFKIVREKNYSFLYYPPFKHFNFYFLENRYLKDNIRFCVANFKFGDANFVLGQKIHLNSFTAANQTDAEKLDSEFFLWYII